MLSNNHGDGKSPPSDHPTPPRKSAIRDSSRARILLSGRRLVAKIFEWAQDYRRRVRNCSNDRSGRGLHTRLLKIANSPYYGQTSHRAPVLFGKQFGKSVLKQHTSKKADHLQP